MGREGGEFGQALQPHGGSFPHLSTGDSIGLGRERGSHWFGCDSSSHEMGPKEGQERQMGHGPGVETQEDTESTEGGDTEKSVGGA